MADAKEKINLLDVIPFRSELQKDGFVKLAVTN